MDKLLVGYNSNKIAIFDLLNRQLHPWTTENLDRIPRNFLNRYNKFSACIQLSDNKYLMHTSYTFCVLNLDEPLPDQVEMVANHPTRTLEGKQLAAQTWFDSLKLSQAKYLTQSNQLPQAGATPQQSPSQNLAINNRFKGILLMDYSAEEKRLRVVEHSWKQAI